MYADDLTLVATGDGGQNMERSVQEYLNQLLDWLETTGLKVGIKKPTQ
jgi:hypothetical protein